MVLKRAAKATIKALDRAAWIVALQFEILSMPPGDYLSRRTGAIHRKLGIPKDYSQRGLPFHDEATELVAVPSGLKDRCFLMTPSTRSQYLAMRSAANYDDISLMIRWSFRSVDEQAQLIRAQLAYGKSIDRILK